ncbi:hypothetical protein FQN54_005869 [Arachnomyces sp. PD_36]|nr:hypothetical protein FQN54_005869 [Arachnomyces sp. PD_36]
MQKLPSATSSTLRFGRRHGLIAQRLQQPRQTHVAAAGATRTVTSIAQQNPVRAQHVDAATGTWSPPSSTVHFSVSERRATTGLNDSSSDPDRKPPDERIVKLGKTLRILSPLLPNILVHPLPQEILSPSVTLHLFPSTHPHLPTVKGRVPYRAALWTAPVAWGSVPIVGDVKLQVVSERIVRAGCAVEFTNKESCGDEKLVVRWKTEGKHRGSDATSGPKEGSPDTSPQSLDNTSSTGSSSSSNGTNRGLSALLGGDSPIFKLGKEEQFSGLFIFSFDEEGRISSHTIEHADEINGWDRTARVVTLTDWLLGKAKGGPSLEPGLAFERQHERGTSCSKDDCHDSESNDMAGRLQGGGCC